jgi:hypothetical protein
MRRPARKPQPAADTPTPCSVYRWDLDKTYLKSEFDSVRDLVRIPFEKAEDKVAAPGVVALIHELRAVGGAAGREVRVFFLSASPPQIGRAIREKLALDGIEYDGIVFKNQLQHLVRGKFRNLREHIGYKLIELLKGRREVPLHAHEFLFGDDWESDPFVYSLYADLIAGRVVEDELRAALAGIPVDPQQIEEIAGLRAALERRDAVVRIYINLERRTPPASFHVYGPRLVPTFNYFQTAACLFDDGELTLGAVARVAESLLDESGYTPERLANSLADVTRRGHVGERGATALRMHLTAQNLLPRVRMVTRRARPWWRRVLAWLRRRRAPAQIAGALRLEYAQLARELRASRSS